MTVPFIESAAVIGMHLFPWSRWNPIPPAAGPHTPRKSPEAEAAAVVPVNAGRPVDLDGRMRSCGIRTIIRLLVAPSGAFG